LTDHGIAFPEDKFGTAQGELPEEPPVEEVKVDEVDRADKLLLQALETVE